MILLKGFLDGLEIATACWEMGEDSYSQLGHVSDVSLINLGIAEVFFSAIQ